MKHQNRSRLPWHLFTSELVGTALLVSLGLSLVILMFGAGSPGAQAVPSKELRLVITGFLFGGIGGLLAVSPVGKISGAHINPAVTLGFWLFNKLDSRTALGYVLAQFIGAIMGAIPLLGWGAMGRSVAFGATLPGAEYSIWTALLGEVIATFALVGGLCVFIGFRRLRPFTPAMIPVLFAILVPLEAPISGTSVNPARTIGPAIISGEWHGWWIYWVGPGIGTLLASVACGFLAKRIHVAKLYYFDSDPEGWFRRMRRSN